MSISTVTSEALQLKLRQLLPSQQGFGTDLSASDTIIPIIDLTEAAEGSDVPQNLQEALALGSSTDFSESNSSSTIVSTTGFYRIFGTSTGTPNTSGAARQNTMTISGLTSVVVYRHAFPSVTGGTTVSVDFDFVVFLPSGNTLSAASSNPATQLVGSTRQIADINGVLVNPVGFSPQ